VSIDVIQLIIAGALGLVALALATLRWLRVAQREHYIAPWVTIIAGLWARRLNLALYLVCVVLIVTALVGEAIGTQSADLRWAAIGAIALLLFLPIGLGVRGRTGALNWTARLQRLLAVWLVLFVIIAGILTLLLGVVGIAIPLLTAPLLVDLALVILRPIEKRLSRKFLVSARKRLKQVGPKVVAITGSYGKTSTKGYVAHLLGNAFSVVASPASFNNLMGLSRAVNERVVPGTEVFVAEMGVYGRGEIRELSESFPPDIAAITTIGEAHLARMGSREVIFQAKAEITEKAGTVVLPIDEPMLLGLAEKCRAEGKRVITVSTSADTPADVVVADSTVTVLFDGAPQQSAPVTIPNVGHAVNLAVAVGIATALGVPLSQLAPRLAALPYAAHRAEVQQSALPSGGSVIIIDDTYNSNPVGAARAVDGAAQLAAERGGELVVVTPGMVELGSVQRDRNRAFAAQVTAVGGHVFAIGRTNRAALVYGAPDARLFARRELAVAAALDQAGERGVILYENDLPDHYP
jgi:UDP-N-acetylmuramoyl-tripeptide--D-alanyl-D-alanine ligase